MIDGGSQWQLLRTNQSRTEHHLVPRKWVAAAPTMPFVRQDMEPTMHQMTHGFLQQKIYEHLENHLDFAKKTRHCN